MQGVRAEATSRISRELSSEKTVMMRWCHFLNQRGSYRRVVGIEWRSNRVTGDSRMRRRNNEKATVLDEVAKVFAFQIEVGMDESDMGDRSGRSSGSVQ
jgi:hypothetical protein